MRDFVLLFTIGGLYISVLAVTRLPGDRRRWWPIALLVALVGAIINTWDDLQVGRIVAAGPELIAYAWVFFRYTFSTLFVAGLAWIGCRIRLPGIIRAPACLVTDLTIRWGPADAVFILFCGLGSCDV